MSRAPRSSESQQQILDDPQMREQRIALEYDAAVRARLARQRLPVDEKFPSARRLDAEQHLQERRLATARCADDRHELMIADLQIDVFEHDLRAEILPKPFDRDLRHRGDLAS